MQRAGRSRGVRRETSQGQKSDLLIQRLSGDYRGFAEIRLADLSPDRSPAGNHANSAGGGTLLKSSAWQSRKAPSQAPKWQSIGSQNQDKLSSVGEDEATYWTKSRAVQGIWTRLFIFIHIVS